MFEIHAYVVYPGRAVCSVGQRELSSLSTVAMVVVILRG